MSDVSDDSYLYAVAAASVVLIVDKLRNVGGRKGAHGYVRPLSRSRSEVSVCDLLLNEL